MNILSARNLSVRLGSREILQELDLDLRAGEVVVLLGPNGAGKSTLVRALAGELEVRGDLCFGGRPMAAWHPRVLARHRGVMPQRVDVNFPLTVEEVIRLGRNGRNPQADEAVLEQVLHLLSLHSFRYRKMPELSGGEQQRVQLARVLAQILDTEGPRLLLLDECTSALDPAYQQQVVELVQSLAREQDMAVLAVVHDLNLAARLADSLLVLRDGRKVASGPVSRVLTPAMLASVYGYRARVVPLPEGYPVVVPEHTGVQVAPLKPVCRQAS